MMARPAPHDAAAPHVALYAGSFDPITLGHLDVLARARRMFDALVLGIGQNPDKPALFSLEERLGMARTLVDELLRSEPDGAPVRVDCYDGLTVDFARKVGAVAILRGLRNLADVAVETQLAITNRQVAAIETVFIVTGEAYAFTSSSLIRQIAALGDSLEGLQSMVPPLVVEHLQRKREDPRHPLRRLVSEQLMD